MKSSTLHDDNRVRIAFLAVAVVPIAVAVLVALTGDWLPVGDDGLLSLRVDDVGTKHHPWLGSWTSASLTLDENVNNPGAWYAYLSALPVAAFGPVAGAAVAVGLLNGLAVIGTWLAGLALGGPRAGLCALAGAVGLAWAMGGEMLIDIWQPHALLLPAVLLFLLAAGVAAGKAEFLPWLMGVASLVVQTHLGYVYLVGLALVGVLVAFVISNREWRRAGWRSIIRARALWLTLVVLFFAWLPALIEQLRYGDDGNLARLVRSIGSGDAVVGPRLASGLAAHVFTAPWSRNRFGGLLDGVSTPDGTPDSLEIPGLPPTWLALLILGGYAALIGSLFIWARRSSRSNLAGGLAAGAIIYVAALIALVFQPLGHYIGPHHMRWLFAVGIFLQIVLCWGIVEWVWARRPRVDPSVAVALIIVVAAAATLVPVAHDHGPVADRWARPTLWAVDAALDDLEIPGPVVFDSAGLRLFEPFSGTVLMFLAEDGVDFRVDEEEEDFVAQLGRARERDGSEIGRMYQLEGFAALRETPDDCQLLLVDGADDDEAAAIRVSAAQMADALLSSEISVDEEALRTNPRLDVIAVIRAEGLRADAENLVLDGTLADWIAEGYVVLADSVRPAHSAEQVAAWVRTVYALYLETSAPCPE